ncbi:hypothetical protein CYMTET_43719 [Cymbomonas tetramitiformis]|uniref:Uncharacterized protein n=1 Tax=Cymbomonas tetramitiformis TaxID=36881 RepID=A0AAE0F0D0_9CHLO|nr:hypothetical protein CYMTET_43719 [Cymbomonas tetramitiformis]
MPNDGEGVPNVVRSTTLSVYMTGFWWKYAVLWVKLFFPGVTHQTDAVSETRYNVLKNVELGGNLHMRVDEYLSRRVALAKGNIKQFWDEQAKCKSKKIPLPAVQDAEIPEETVGDGPSLDMEETWQRPGKGKKGKNAPNARDLELQGMLNRAIAEAKALSLSKGRIYGRTEVIADMHLVGGPQAKILSITWLSTFLYGKAHAKGDMVDTILRYVQRFARNPSKHAICCV